MQHSQNSPQPETNTNPALSQLKSQKTPTHLTIQQENQNHKQAAKQKPTQNKTINKNPEDKKFRKLSKQSKKVKSLEEEYRQLEEQLREIKQLIQLQVQMINYSTQQINEKSTLTAKSPSKHPLKLQHKQKSPKLSISNLQSCLSKLFSYHQTIQTANSNYLLLSQVNKQEESQQIFHIHNLEERIRQLRFLLNGKEDLLAYELATFEGCENVQQDGPDARKIFIDYHLPRRQSLGSKNNMQSEFRFVQKVVGELTKLKKSVKELQNQLASDNMQCSSQQNEENHGFDEKDSIKENESDPHSKLDSRYATPKTTRRRESDNGKIFSEIQNNLLSAQTSRTPQKGNTTNSKKSQNQKSPTKIQPTLLPLSIQNYRHSLIYRVGKLQMAQQQYSKKLKSEYQKLTKELNSQLETKKKLVKEYQLKRDVYEYKKKLLNQNKFKIGDMIKMGDTSTKYERFCTENILDELKELSIENGEVEITKSPQERQLENNQSISQNSQLKIQNSPPKQVQTQEYKVQPTSKSISIIDLSTCSPKKEEESPSTPQKQVLFQELTNSQTTPNRKSIKNPFLKLKNSDENRKHFPQQENLSSKTPKKEKKLYQDGEKENVSKKDISNLKQFITSTEKYLDKENDEKPVLGIVAKLDRQTNEQIAQPNKMGRSTLRRRRDNAKKNLKQAEEVQKPPIQTLTN